jgi:hypothetical protein
VSAFDIVQKFVHVNKLLMFGAVNRAGMGVGLVPVQKQNANPLLSKGPGLYNFQFLKGRDRTCCDGPAFSDDELCSCGGRGGVNICREGRHYPKRQVTNVRSFTLLCYQVITIKRVFYMGFYLEFKGARDSERLRHYATNRKVAGSIPDEVIFFYSYLILPAALGPGLYSASNRIFFRPSLFAICNNTFSKWW